MHNRQEQWKKKKKKWARDFMQMNECNRTMVWLNCPFVKKTRPLAIGIKNLANKKRTSVFRF
jgi:hypothetical protein